MSESDSAARRISEMLVEELRAIQVSAEQLVVVPQSDGLVVQWVSEGGAFQQVTLNDRAWYAKFREDEGRFVRELARGLPRRLPDSFWNVKGELDLQYLFVRVINDLDAISRSTDDYDNLRVASLLRLLVLDDRPLIHRVNRLHTLPITFWVGRTLVDGVVDPSTLPSSKKPRIIKTRDGRLFDAVGDAFDPVHYRGTAEELRLDQFCKVLLVKVENHFVSLREFVSHMAYVEGLVHFGNPKAKRPADPDLQRWRRMLALEGRGPLLATLSAVGRVVVSSMVPLVHECQRAISEGRTVFPEDNDASSGP